jgi:hypothetical protein
MASEISMTNESFSFLKNSGAFLNIIVNNINSCILLLDRDMKLRAFNDALKTIFSNKKNEDLMYMRCGEAIGCAHQIEEQKECGNTSQCCDCDLRLAALNSYMDNKTIYKNHVEKPFFTYDHTKVNKHLQFSTRLFIFDQEKYIIMIVEDISKWFEKRNADFTQM